MRKQIVTLRSEPSATLEFPEKVKVGKEDRKLERSCFGALRLFPGLPRTVSEDELKHIKEKYPEVFERLHVKPYVESKRIDLRGVSEAELDQLAEKEGLSHLPPREQIRRLRERKKLPVQGKRSVNSLPGKKDRKVEEKRKPEKQKPSN